MPSTRRSARIASSPHSSPAQNKESPKAAVGSKRKADAGASPAAKRGRKAAPKEQQTIEESMDIDTSKDKETEPTPSEEAPKEQQNGHRSQKIEQQVEDKADQHNPSAEEKPTTTEDPQGDDDQNTPNTKPEPLPRTGDDSAPAQDQISEEKSHEKLDEKPKVESKENGQAQSHVPSQETAGTNGDSAIEPHARDKHVPASILEKGIIYFFYKGRVGVDDPANVQDIARSYVVLRPLPHGAKLGDGPITAGKGKCRLLALPKKVLPVSDKDKFMIFVESAKTSFDELRNEFLPASNYDTQTAGVRHTPAATPIAEGVYAITSTGRDSHLAYMLTIPSEDNFGDVQKDMGLRPRGSFVTSVRNPSYEAPSYAQLPQKPEFPQEMLDKFHSLRWTALEPEFLDYANTQFLLIGGADGIGNAVKPQDGDEKKDDPLEELEKLEGEDEIRVQHLQGTDAIFADLGISQKDYPKIPTTWSL